MYLCISKTSCGFLIHADGHEKMRYIGYNRKEAIRKYRKDNGLVGKHLELIEV